MSELPNASPPFPLKINPKLQPFLVEVGSLRPDPKNARKHGSKNLRTIADLLIDVGQQVLLVCDESGKIIKGNGTYRAATELLGWTQIAAVVFDQDARAARRFGLGDNRAAELAEWEYEELADLVREALAEGDRLAGWEEHELEPLLQAVWEPPVATDSDSFDEGARTGNKPSVPKIVPGHLFGTFTPEQAGHVEKALAKVRERAADSTLTHEQALVRLCQEYLG